MNSDSCHIREATVADLEALVDLHYRVFDEHTHYGVLLGRRFIRATYRWYCQNPTAFALVGEIDGQIKGSCTVNQGPYHAVFKANVRELVLAFLRRPMLLLVKPVRLRLLSLVRGHSPRERIVGMKASSAYLGYLAVDATARGAGIGPALIRMAIHECEERGWQRIVSDVHRTNVSARFMYKTLGFEEAPDSIHSDLVEISFERLRSARGIVQTGDLHQGVASEHGQQTTGGSKSVLKSMHGVSVRCVSNSGLVAEDIESLVRLHLGAFPGFFLTSLGPGFLRLLYRGFVEIKDGICIVAENENGLVGFAAGATQPDSFFRTLLRKRGVLFALAALPALLQNPVFAARKCLGALLYRGERPKALPDAGFIENIAVMPTASGRGVGQQLIVAFCDELRQRGVGSVYLATDASDNERVNAFYKKCGFRLIDTYYRAGRRRMNQWAKDI
jgi:ribosomal protein S18 acetylase RimI-like enzyme